MANIYITIAQISMALEFLHINDYVYFDLKAENVVFVQDDNHRLCAKLIDIGSCIHVNYIYVDEGKNKLKRLHSELQSIEKSYQANYMKFKALIKPWRIRDWKKKARKMMSDSEKR